MPLKLQVMEGVGTPVEVQVMSTESPSRTVTVGPLMAVVVALTKEDMHTYCDKLCRLIVPAVTDE